VQLRRIALARQAQSAATIIHIPLSGFVNIPILFAHPTFGVLGILAAVWVLVEALNANKPNLTRLRYAALAVTVCMVLAWVLGGYYWYTIYNAPDKAIILKGPWPWAQFFVMETKEQLFFIPLILALYLPIATAANLTVSRGARMIVMAVAAFGMPASIATERSRFSPPAARRQCCEDRGSFDATTGLAFPTTMRRLICPFS
jgi:hypothetical protein